MDVREKLTDLLTGCSIDTQQDVEYVVDHLLGSGVTVQEWIPVTERLPEKDGAYIAALNHHFGVQQGVSIRSFAKDGETIDEYELAGEKYVWYLYDSEYGYVSTNSVTHWMPLPQPPKGE